eukprot:CAMPEP_0201481856 /NCGR_PEP_ID=MMETSP0151_2-20130828/6116_1 /ASSEMBLY_ACC=CAM_ASM_000257 /TAXON_ID=200890 /ORGANISM="Paramoeba atlantica, Strain 621/1 / CCAP 1560/9" /LENGTH=753 /DNA_ID=CAMNT_0047864253 /DNA_START=555 /DNA_END=2816 /DNA_ORIENTATION=-
MGGGDIEVLAIDNSTGPMKSIKVMQPDPANPYHASLPENTLFHPTYLQRVKERNWQYFRTMDMTETNDNPQQDWFDRRLPSNVMQTGVINPRSPAPNYEWAGYNHTTGSAYEFLVMLANDLGLDMWLNIPHLATDDFITQLAQLVLYGSDGVNPYTSPQQHPAYPPLRSDLKLYLEYSNEIWSGGPSFAQGEWAQNQASSQGITKPQFNAHQFCRMYSIFQSVWGSSSSRLMRVAATWTIDSSSYTTPFLDEMEVSCPQMNPPTTPDALAITTYFGNGIQDYVWDQGWWNHSADDPYWTSQEHLTQIIEAFDEWDRRQLSESSATGGGPDSTSGMAQYVGQAYVSATDFSLKPLYLIGYEGGPSIYTDMYDNGSGNTSGITTFMDHMNQHPRIQQSYNIALSLANEAGIETHSAYEDVGPWSKYGQWGHLQQVDQPLSEAPKWDFLRQYYDNFSSINPKAEPTGSVPSFVHIEYPRASPDGTLLVPWGKPYEISLIAEGGEGILTYTTIADWNMGGLTETGNGSVISGCPNVTGVGYHLVRVLDEDGDANWNTFEFQYYAIPGEVFEAEFWSEPNPALYSDWTGTLFVDSDRVANYSGLVKGPGTTGNAGNYSYYFQMRSSSSSLSLPDAMSQGNYISFNLTASSLGLDLSNATLSFTIRRSEYWAPQNYAWFTSIGGFDNQNEMVYTTGSFNSQSPQFFSFQLPVDEKLYQMAPGEEIEFRVYGYEGEYSQQSSLEALSLVSFLQSPPPPSC